MLCSLSANKEAKVMNEIVSFRDTFLKLTGRLTDQLQNNAYWNARFDRFARTWSKMAGKPIAFNVALLVILTWVITGPLFGFSDTWQLIINTATTIVTFLMVFLIQNSQNRDTDALQVKLDELIRAVEGANNELLDLEEIGDEELKLLRKQYLALARLSRKKAGKQNREGNVGQELS